MTRFPLLALCLLSACAGSKDSATDSAADSAGADLSPYEMPFVGGCTYAFTRDDDGNGTDELRSEDQYDASERLIERQVVYTDLATVHYSLNYEDDCLVAYDDGTVYDSEDYTDTSLTYTQTCDDQGNATGRVGTSNGRDFTVAYANTYDDEDLIQVDAAQTWLDTATTTTYRWVYAWEDGEETYKEVWVNEVQISEESWTYEEGLLVLDAYTDLADAENNTEYSFTYDEHARLSTEAFVQGSRGLVWTDTFSWFDGIYHTQTISEDDDGDGVADSLTTWDCSEAWPWSCSGDADGEPWNSEAPDGVADSLFTEGWTCD